MAALNNPLSNLPTGQIITILTGGAIDGHRRGRAAVRRRNPVQGCLDEPDVFGTVVTAFADGGRDCDLFCHSLVIPCAQIGDILEVMKAFL